MIEVQIKGSLYKINMRVLSQTTIIKSPQVWVKICINKALRQRAPERPGGGFNLGVDPKKPVATVTFWHCDTFALFANKACAILPVFPSTHFVSCTIGCKETGFHLLSGVWRGQGVVWCKSNRQCSQDHNSPNSGVVSLLIVSLSEAWNRKGPFWD